MTTESIKPLKLAVAISDRIQRMILEGAFRPGERLLSERELSAKLGVSRPSLREALDRLVGLGLLTTNARGVAFVSKDVGKSFVDPIMLLMDTHDARIDCLELRSAMESEAAGFAAERASDVDREAIRAQFDAMTAAHDAQDVDQIAKADAEFHFAIYEASHNVILLHFMRSLESLLRSNVYLNRKNLYVHRAGKDNQLQEHQEIYEAIMARDPERAREAARHHITTAIKTQRDIHETERRLETSIRRMSGKDFVRAK